MKQLILMFVMILFATSCGDGLPDWKDEGEGTVRTSVKTSQKTISGSTVYSLDGLSNNQLALIDSGLNGLKADVPDWYRVLNNVEYEINIPIRPCELTPIDRVYAFKVRINWYDGTDYDQYNTKGKYDTPVVLGDKTLHYVPDGVGVVFAPEMTGSNKSMTVCSNESILENAVRYGAEHSEAFANDPSYYGNTMYHSTGGHPLYPKPDVLTRSTEHKEVYQFNNKYVVLAK